LQRALDAAEDQPDSAALVREFVQACLDNPTLGGAGGPRSTGWMKRAGERFLATRTVMAEREIFTDVTCGACGRKNAIGTLALRRAALAEAARKEEG
jgi:hypothetical protein